MRVVLGAVEGQEAISKQSGSAAAKLMRRLGEWRVQGTEPGIDHLCCSNGEERQGADRSCMTGPQSSRAPGRRRQQQEAASITINNTVR